MREALEDITSRVQPSTELEESVQETVEVVNELAVVFFLFLFLVGQFLMLTTSAAVSYVHILPWWMVLTDWYRNLLSTNFATFLGPNG